MPETPTIKGEARRLVEQLPDDATWEDLLYEIYVRQAIEAGLKDCREGRTRARVRSSASPGVADMNVEWSESATAQLQAIRDSLSRTSPGYAQALADRIIRRTEGLASQPRLGAEVPEYSEETIREVFEHPYRILYRVSGDLLQVVAIVHASRQLPRSPPG